MVLFNFLQDQNALHTFANRMFKKDGAKILYKAFNLSKQLSEKDGNGKKPYLVINIDQRQNIPTYYRIRLDIFKRNLIITNNYF